MARTKVKRAVAPYRAIRQLELNAEQEFARQLQLAKASVRMMLRQSEPDPEFHTLLKKGISHSAESDSTLEEAMGRAS